MYACNPMALRHTTPPTYSNGMWYPGSVESHYSAAPLFGSSTNNSPDSAANTADTSPQRSSPATAQSTIRCNGPILLPKIRCQDQPNEPATGMATAPMSANTQPSPVMSVVSNVNRQSVQMGVPTIHTQFPFPYAFKRRATASPESRAVGIDSPMSACSLPSSFFNASNMVNTPTGLAEMGAPAVRPSPLGAEYLSAGNTGMTTTSLGPRLDTSAAISGSRRSSLAHVRTISSQSYSTNSSLPSPADSHSRHASTGSSSTVIDENALLKHGYPTQYHRGMPQYITATPSPVTTPTVTLTPTLPVQPLSGSRSQQSDFNSYLIPATPIDSMISPEATANPLFASEQLMLPPQPHPTAQTITLMKYLTTPGPTPNLISRSVTNLQAQRDYGWWDVRNLRSWTTFNMQSLLSIPSIPDLLNCPIDKNILPPHQGQSSPGLVSRGNPENEYALRDTLFEFFGKRVNAALQVAQGQHKHLALRVMNSATTLPTPRPDFIVTYANDGFVRTTGRGELRGHVVGIVKAYDEWNTGMRSEDAPSKVKYLKGLAQLHRIMREHGCRYGFIVTEIELLCVRAGADPQQPQMQQFNPHMMFHQPIPHVNAFGSDEGPKPIFGWLETSNPIPLSMAAVNEDSRSYNMTAGLALWFLCMLARDDPLPGQAGWRMDVGGPAALTRQNKRPRDDWMPRVGVHESRVAKRIRGWVYPEDPYSRKEAPNVKRGRR